MRKIFKSFVTLLLAVLLLGSFGVSAFADSTVTYGADRKFRFGPDAELFNSFKAVMPGDSFTETIYIRNEFTGSKYVYIYLQAVPHDPSVGAHMPQVAATENYADMMAFLSQLSLSVTQDGRSISLASADQPAGLAGRQLIGAFSGRGQSTIKVTLSVPITLGNEYADSMGEIDWLFVAEEWNTPINLKTGDDGNAALWTAVLSCSVLAAALLFLFMRRRKKSA